jgi:hypothetical protein
MPAGAAAGVPGTPRILFSSGQIVFSAILLGPLPPVYMLASNLRAMGKGPSMRRVLYGGYALVTFELVAAYFIPGRTGISTTFLGLNAGLAMFAYMYQPDWSAISRSTGYLRARSWRVIWVCMVRTLECLVWGIGIFALLDYMGLHPSR